MSVCIVACWLWIFLCQPPKTADLYFDTNAVPTTNSHALRVEERR